MMLSVSALLPTLKVLINFLQRCTEDKMDFVLDALFKQSISFKGYKMSWNIYNIGFEQMLISLYCSDQMRKPLAHMISCSHESVLGFHGTTLSMDWRPPIPPSSPPLCRHSTGTPRQRYTRHPAPPTDQVRTNEDQMKPINSNCL